MQPACTGTAVSFCCLFIPHACYRLTLAGLENIQAFLARFCAGRAIYYLPCYYYTLHRWRLLLATWDLPALLEATLWLCGLTESLTCLHYLFCGNRKAAILYLTTMSYILPCT